MSKVIFALATAASVCVVSSASATKLIEEDFSYPDGVITTVSGGTWTSYDAGNGHNSVIGGVYVMNDDTTGDVGIDFGVIDNVNAPGKVYAGFDFTVDPSDPPTTASGAYFAYFRQPGGNFTTGVFLAQGSTTGKYKLGFDSTPASAGPVFFGDEFDAGSTYRVVVGLDFYTDLGGLWVNPTSIGDTNISQTLGAGFNSTQVFVLRGANSNDGDKTIDNLIIATTFDEAVPEPTSLALLGLGGLLVARRRRG